MAGFWEGLVSTPVNFATRVFGDDSDRREAYAPERQYWGGSKEESDRYRARNEKRMGKANKMVFKGVQRSNAAADKASAQFDDQARMADNFVRQYNADSEEAKARAMQSADEYQSGRLGTLGNAQKLEQMGDAMPEEYRRTAQAQFQAQQDANQRAALSLAAGAGGGAAGAREALATSGEANAAAAQQAAIIQAQEENALRQQQAAAYANAAGIRGNVGQSDLSAAGLMAGREAGARDAVANQQGIRGQSIGQSYNAQMGAAGLQANAYTQSRGQFLGAEAAQANAELAAQRENEMQRQNFEKDDYTRDSFILKRFNAPV